VPARLPGLRAMAAWLCVLAAACTNEPGAGPAEGDLRSPAVTANESVLVRGWIRAGEVGLEPVLVTDAPSRMPAPGEGPYRLRGLNDDGAMAFDIGFGDEALVAVTSAAEHHFEFVIPVGEGGALALSRIELDAGAGRRFAREARLSAAALRGAFAGERALALERTGAGELRLRWNSADFPVMQLRDPDSGAVLAVARHGELTLATERTELELTLSEGVRSATGRVRVR
jgi:hypothetical protein